MKKTNLFCFITIFTIQNGGCITKILLIPIAQIKELINIYIYYFFAINLTLLCQNVVSKINVFYNIFHNKTLLIPKENKQIIDFHLI